MSSQGSWSRRSTVPGNIRPVYGAQYPPLSTGISSSHPEAVTKPTTNDSPPTNSKPAEAKFASFNASVSDAWSLDEPDRIINSAASQKAAQTVINQHQSSTRLEHSSPSSSGQKYRYIPGPRAKAHGMQLLATQKEPLPVPSVGDVDSTGTNLYPKLPAISRPQPSSPSKELPSAVINRTHKIEQLLLDTNVDIERLRQECWKGIPSKLRPLAWRLCSGYLPSNADRRDATLKNKRDEYWNFVEQYYHTRHEEQHSDTFRQIHIDIPRMCPLIPLFQQKIVQEMFERILYIWAIRHPASGYVQGINDLVTPFFVVFLSEYIRTDTDVGVCEVSDLKAEHRNIVEADSFWCVTRLLDTVQDNYTFAQPGVQRKIIQLEQLVERVDNVLHHHFKEHQVEYLQFAFRWMNNLLMREIPLRCTIRLWDTYLCEVNGFATFHVYVCAAFLRTWSKQVLGQKDFQNIMLFLQNLPTHNWTDQQISELCADAYSLMCLFAGTKNHLLPSSQ